MEEKITKRGAIWPIILILILVILVGVWYWWSKKVSVPTAPVKKPTEKVIPKEDSVSAINQELEGIQTLDLEKEFKEIDQDLNSL